MKKLSINKVILGFLFLMIGLSVNTVHAQQDAQFSQYMFNGLYLNPGYAGSKGYFCSNLIFRSQWVSIPGAPITLVGAADMLLTNEKVGVGLVASYDRIGVTSQTDIFANGAYHIKLGEKLKLGLGIKAGISVIAAQLSDLTVWDQGDAKFNNVNGITVPRIGFGGFLYSEKFYVGLSAPTLLAYESGMKFNIDVERGSSLARHYYLTGGYVFDVHAKWKVKPSVLFKYLPNAPFQADINAQVMYDNMISMGVSYRTGDAVAILLLYQANKNFRIGYCYDISVSGLSKYNSGSHEIMIGYDLGQKLTTIKSPRFF